MRKSITPAPYNQFSIPGQVPNRPVLKQLNALTAMPVQPEEYAQCADEPMFRPDNVASGLGLDFSQQRDWSNYLNQSVRSAPNELVLRQSILAKAHGLDHAARSVLLARSLRYWRNVNLAKALFIGPRGGKWANAAHTIAYREDEHKPQTLHEKMHAARELGRDAFEEGRKALPQADHDLLAHVVPTAHAQAKQLWVKGWMAANDGKPIPRIADPTESAMARQSRDSIVRPYVPSELFARAFESSVQDVLTEQKRASTYLVAGTQGIYNSGVYASQADMEAGKEAQVFPQGEERIRIRNAIKQLIAVMQTEKTLEKSLQRLERFYILEKAEPLGGKYHRRIPQEHGGFRYIYDEDRYQARKDAHVAGHEAVKARIRKHVHTAVAQSGKTGHHIAKLKQLVERHGAEKISEVLRESVNSGKMKFDKGCFYAVGNPNSN